MTSPTQRTLATRRSFLATSLAATAGLALAPTALAGRRGVRAVGGGRLAGWAGRGGRAGGETILSWDELSPGVHAMIDPNTGGNVAVVVSSGEGLVIDTKFPFFGQAIREDAGALGGATLTLVNTHHHSDHTGGNCAFMGGDEPIQMLAHRKATHRIREQLDMYVKSAAGGPKQINTIAPDNERLNELARGMATQAESLKASAWVPRLGLGNEGTITIGDLDVTFNHYGPGHTDNDLVLRIDDGRVLHTGDLVFNGLHPFFDPEVGATAHGWLESLGHVLEACNPDTIVIPGHGPAGDRESVSKQIAYFESLIEVVQKEIDAGATKEDTQAKSWPFMEGLGFEALRGRTIGAVYDELKG